MVSSTDIYTLIFTFASIFFTIKGAGLFFGIAFSALIFRIPVQSVTYTFLKGLWISNELTAWHSPS